MTILITGGTGTLGRPTAELLRAAGHDVRILSRSTGGDLSTGAGLAEALVGVDTVLHLATAASKKDVAQTARLLEAAAGVEHVVYISIVGVDTVPYPYYRAKFACEKLIEASGIPYTILRATQFHSFLAMVPRAQRKLPVIFSLNAPDQPIAVEEVAARLVELVEAGPSGFVADIGGPEQLTVREAIDIWQRAAGTRKPVWTIPLGGRMMRALRAGGHMPGLPGFGTERFATFAEREASKYRVDREVRGTNDA